MMTIYQDVPAGDADDEQTNHDYYTIMITT